MALQFGNKTVFLNEMETGSYIKTITDVCMVLAKNIAKRDNKTVNDVLTDAYLYSGREIWNETFNSVVKTLTN